MKLNLLKTFALCVAFFGISFSSLQLDARGGPYVEPPPPPPLYRVDYEVDPEANPVTECGNPGTSCIIDIL